MQKFRILYFRESELLDAETLEAANILPAMEKASERPGNLRVEIWTDKGKVATIGVSRANFR